MADLRATGLGRKFNQQWIFRDINLSLTQGDRLLLRGPNGAGKSTLLRMLAGQLTPTTGTCELLIGGNAVQANDWYRHISWTGPYIDLFTDFTLQETLDLHFRFRSCLAVSTAEIPALLRLENQTGKALRHFSSGMLARVKAGLAVLSASEVLLLDEPTANMDAENSAWFFDLLDRHLNQRILIFASNTQAEFSRFSLQLDLSKKA